MATTAMAKCPKCGAIIPAQSVSCPKCGTRFKRSTSTSTGTAQSRAVSPQNSSANRAVVNGNNATKSANQPKQTPSKVEKKKNSWISVAALVCSLLFITGPVAVILSIIDIAKKDDEHKHGLSIAAMIIGFLGCMGWVSVFLPNAKDDASQTQIEARNSTETNSQYNYEQAVANANTDSDNYNSSKATMIMPDVLGLEKYDAKSDIRNALGSYVDFDEELVYSDIYEKGVVVRTEPVAGAMVGEGATVTLYTSKGKEKIMPNLIGMDVESAEQLLSDMDISMYTTEIFSESDKNTIVAAEFDPGTDLSDEYSVDVEVSKGSLQAFKDSTQVIGYEDLYRYPETYEETPLKINATITKIEDSRLLGITYNLSYWATYEGETVILYDDRSVQEPTLKVGDKITAYGYGDGKSTIDIKQKEYQGSLLIGFSYNKTVDSYYVPKIKVEHFDIR
ncbi:MAG: PASTA domain-containing protein [Butyrivibrio hungatei]|nr:PASTA domain-containing protein [Butyrivibrio hungatei]